MNRTIRFFIFYSNFELVEGNNKRVEFKLMVMTTVALAECRGKLPKGLWYMAMMISSCWSTNKDNEEGKNR